MTREMFVRVATMALRQNAGRSAEEQSEAIALLMDTVAAVIGEGAPPVSTQPPVRAEAARIPFPPVNPEAIAPVIPEPEPEPEPSLIIQSTTMPDRSERQRNLDPVRPADTIPKQQRRLKVEELSRLIQERAPERLVFDVPMEDGRPARLAYTRNVVSMHNYDSVQLIYAPPAALPSAREAAEVMAALHVDDVPFDLSAIVRDLTLQAIKSVRPRRPIVEREPAPTRGPVRHAEDTYVDPQAGAVQAVFNSMG